MEMPSESVATESAVTKGPSRLLLGLLWALILAGGVLALGGITGGGEAADSAEADRSAGVDQRDRQDQPTDDGRADAGATATTSPTPEPPRPVARLDATERQAFRTALAERLVAPCDSLLAGGETISSEDRLEHERCMTEALRGLSTRCPLAAVGFELLPGEETLDVACTIDDGTNGFRQAVRQRMVVDCGGYNETEDLERVGYHDYNRCLLRIDSALDHTCYAIAAVQYRDPNDGDPGDDELRAVCGITAEVELAVAGS